MRIAPIVLALILAVVPGAAFSERPPHLMEKAGGMAVYVHVSDLALIKTVWKGNQPGPSDTHHILVLFRNAETNRAENMEDIKLSVISPSGKTIADTTIKAFIARGISTHGHFLPLEENGKHKAVVSFTAKGKTETVTFFFSRQSAQ